MRKLIYGILIFLIIIGLITQFSTGIRWVVGYLVGSAVVVLIVYGVIWVTSLQRSPRVRSIHKKKKKMHQRHGRFDRKVVKFPGPRKKIAHDRHRLTSGERAEMQVQKILESEFARDRDYLLLHDLLIPKKHPEGEYSQIDHLIISKFGIFVIETKSYGGFVLGHQEAAAKEWAIIDQGIRRNIYSPVKQNRGHIQAIKEQLQAMSPPPHIRINDDIFYSVLIFTNDRVTIKDIPNNVLFTNLHTIGETVRSEQSVKIPGELLHSIRDFLAQTNITDLRVRIKHIKQIKEKTEKNKNHDEP